MEKFIWDFFIDQKPFQDCLKPGGVVADYLLAIKTQPVPLEDAEELAKASLVAIEQYREAFAEYKHPIDETIPIFLDDMVEKIFRISFNIKED